MWLRLLVALILFVFLLPIVLIIPLSFTSVAYFQVPPPGYSLMWYEKVLQSPVWMQVFFRSLIIGLITAIVSLILGTMAAIAFIRLNFWGKKLFVPLMLSPMVVPTVVVAIGLYHFFAPFKLTDTYTGMILSNAVISIPIVFTTVSASLKGVDRNLELAAMGLGSTPVGAFFKITVPIIKTGLFSGALFAFSIVFDEPIISLFMAGSHTKTLPIKYWESLRTSIDPSIAVVSTILIVMTVALFLIQGWMGAAAAKRSVPKE
ncbi:ABC transporter permease subunit [Paenibacillus sp. LMG 31458]|uniref:ABC transporter permease subunit n=1 Tax=Paenibacillus phytorum TaxID=2654977 RepID=A0ABX1Y0S7_9BACL|nr:ABC transporter permease [Paenibacillus phytorum]NOU74458.1 ABC transporter permease subunit [Paenibacillus phytorum]